MTKQWILGWVVALATGCAGANASAPATTTTSTFDRSARSDAQRPTSTSAVADGGAQPAATGVRCQPFCHLIANACQRPAIGEPEYAMISMGEGARLARTDGSTGPHEACDPACCASTQPGPDPDADGVMTDDRCPNEPEDHDGFEDQDGCPDPDNDGDRIDDAHDRCPYGAEDMDGVQDEDGCRE